MDNIKINPKNIKIFPKIIKINPRIDFYTSWVAFNIILNLCFVFFSMKKTYPCHLNVHHFN